MSKEIITITEEESIKAVNDFAALCYNKGAKDALIGTSIAVALPIAFICGIKAVKSWKNGRKLRKSIEEFTKFIKETES